MRKNKSSPTSHSLGISKYSFQFEYGENLDRNTDDLRFPTPSGTTEQEAEIMCKVSNLIFLLEFKSEFLSS